jgi:hypothetical protein
MHPAPPNKMGSILPRLRKLHSDCSGATSTEYILIMALIVLPIGLLMPLFLSMARVYGGRMFSIMGLPFP